MKLKKTYKKNSGKINIIMFILFCVLTLGLTVGYSSLNKELKISAEAVFRKQEDIRITNLELSEIQNEGLENYKSKYSKNTISVGVDLKNTTSTVKYKVTVSNTGNVAMWIESITEELKNNDYMVYELESINIKELIKPGEQRDFYVIFKYKSDINELPQNTTLDEMLRFKFVKPDSVLAEGSKGGATTTFWNGTEIKREEVEEITFSPTLEQGEGSLGFWDASDKKDGTVIAWYKDSDNNGKYELTVGGIGVVYANPTSMYQFYNFSNLVKVDFGEYFDTKNVTDMSYMFYGCTSLTSLDVSKFETSKVTDMSYMFEGCRSLTSLDVSSFDTSEVTNMSRMFDGCRGLISLDLSDFDTSKVTDMNRMFYVCVGLTSLDVSSFNTSKVTNMANMFYGSFSLTSLDVSGFDTSKVTDMSFMFNNCRGLTLLDVSNFDTSEVTNMNSMFNLCSGLTSLDLSSFNTSKVTNMTGMFNNCLGLTSLDVSNFDTSAVKYMGSMFKNCRSLTSLDLSSFDTSAATNMSVMFYECNSLNKVILKDEKLKEALINSYGNFNCEKETISEKYTCTL